LICRLIVDRHEPAWLRVNILENRSDSSGIEANRDSIVSQLCSGAEAS
jgi:hypothetical protein